MTMQSYTSQPSRPYGEPAGLRLIAEFLDVDYKAWQAEKEAMYQSLKAAQELRDEG